jgi:hypothetical protein
VIEATIELFGGKSSIKVSAEDSKDLIQQMAFFTAIPSKCDICGASLHFSFRNPDPKVKYWGVVCEGQIPHTLNFGVHTDEGKGLFVKDEWEYYDVENQEYRKVKAREVKAQPQQQAKPPQEQKPNVDTISPHRLKGMISELVKIGIAEDEQLAFARANVKRKLYSLADITNDEAQWLWQVAKNRQA